MLRHDTTVRAGEFSRMRTLLKSACLSLMLSVHPQPVTFSRSTNSLHIQLPFSVTKQGA